MNTQTIESAASEMVHAALIDFDADITDETAYSIAENVAYKAKTAVHATVIVLREVQTLDGITLDLQVATALAKTLMDNLDI